MRQILLTLVVVFPLALSAVVINGYAEITALSGTSIAVSNVNESYDTFEAGDWLVIYQTQDDVIGGYTGNNANFGNLGSIASAGLYEIREILSVSESSGIPTTITLTESISNSYNVGENSNLQAITFPRFGNPDYTTTQPLNALNWDGNVGGVIAFEVLGVLTLAHNIRADAAGFRGGIANNDGASAGCSGNSNFRVVAQNNFANKGEGIYKSTDATFAAGQGRILNAGGGGNSHNAGGGGGGNYSQGGQGGDGWPNCDPNPGGYGGLSLNGSITASRVFLGGGGGSGEGNNGVQIGGSRGGGLILIKAEEIRTSGSCGARTISTDGGDVANNNVNDGNGGGGAGGSIVFNVDNWNVASTCPLTISASGGIGGDVGHTAYHGGGGGGGLGAIIFSTPTPTSNISIDNAPGIGGLNCTNCVRAASGQLSDGDGVIPASVGPLPIELISFNALYRSASKDVHLTWSTATEVNNDRFIIQRSKLGSEWEDISIVGGAGNSTQTHYYQTIDPSPFNGVSYYRLTQIDFDGTSTKSDIISVIVNEVDEELLSVFPNPSSGIINILTSESAVQLELTNTQGKLVKKASIQGVKTTLDLTSLPPSIYSMRVLNKNGSVISTTRVIRSK